LCLFDFFSCYQLKNQGDEHQFSTMAAAISNISFILPCTALLATLIIILRFVQGTTRYSYEALCISNLAIQIDQVPKLDRPYRPNHFFH
jgi:hypothetical protein